MHSVFPAKLEILIDPIEMHAKEPKKLQVCAEAKIVLLFNVLQPTHSNKMSKYKLCVKSKKKVCKTYVPSFSKVFGLEGV